MHFGLLLRPGAVTTAFGLILIVVLLFVQLREPVRPVSAAELLQRSSIAEETTAARTDQVLHRSLQMDERTAAGIVIARRKIEIWHSAERGVTARRLFDEQNRLIAGDWRRSDGVQTLYQHHARPLLQLPEKRSTSLLSFDNMWLQGPSAKEFTSLIGRAGQAHVEERPTSYVISYAGETGASAPGLVKATLILSRADLHPTEQTLLVQQGSEVREYRFVEASFERHPPSTVPPAVFEPEAELLRSETEMRTPRDTEIIAASPRPSAAASTSVATAELEVEVLRLLNEAGADMGEQVSVTRTPEGQLQVEGIVETGERKGEILRALGPVKDNSAVKVEINTVAEAIRQKPQAAASSGSVIVERSESGAAAISVDAELRRYFSAQGLSEEQVAANVRRFANLILDRSSQVLQHAWALKRLTERFSPEELRNFSPDARSKWLAMIQQHAQVLQQQTASLRQDLSPIFAAPASNDSLQGPGINDGIDDARDLARTAERLLGICSAQHKLLSSAFTISSDASRASAIRAPQFWRSLGSAEKLSVMIQSVTRELKN